MEARTDRQGGLADQWTDGETLILITLKLIVLPRVELFRSTTVQVFHTEPYVALIPKAISTSEEIHGLESHIKVALSAELIIVTQ